jgi:hypothetical protein
MRSSVKILDALWSPCLATAWRKRRGHVLEGEIKMGLQQGEGVPLGPVPAVPEDLSKGELAVLTCRWLS